MAELIAKYFLTINEFFLALENGSGSGGSQMNPFAMLGGMPGLAGLMGMGGMQGMQGLKSGQNMWGGMAGRGNLPGMGQMGGFNRGMMEQVEYHLP